MIPVFHYLDPAKTAYILRSGRIIMKISERDEIELAGKNIIFGAGEILIQEREGYEQLRSKDVYVSDPGEYEPIPKEKLLKLFKQPKLGYAVAKTIAIALMKVNSIFEIRSKQLGQGAKLAQEYCKIYYLSVDILKKEYKSKRYHWLEKLHDSAVQSLTYQKGKAFYEVSKNKTIKVESQMNELDKVFPHGTVLCEQGEESNDMFILREGTIHVLVGDNVVAEIQDQGTLIGEMALLLGQKRTATLKSHGGVKVSIVNKNNVPNVIKNDPNFFLNIATTHSMWETNNCVLIKELEDQLKIQKEEQNLPKFLKSENKYKEEVFKLKREVMELNRKFNMEFLDNIEDIISDGIESVMEID